MSLMLGISPALSSDTISIEFGEVDTENQVVEILYDNPGQIFGFQFFVLGIDITDVYGGDAENYNFFLNQKHFKFCFCRQSIINLQMI